MHVGWVIYGDLEYTTGGFLYDRQIVGALKAQGHKVSVFSFTWRSYLPHLLDNFSPRLQSWIATINPDVLVQDELVHPSLFIKNDRLRKNFAGPVIALVHHLRSSEQAESIAFPVYRSVECSYLNSVDGFIVNSTTTYKAIENLLGRSAPHVVAYPGRDHIKPSYSEVHIQERATRPGPLKLLFVGSIIRRKGVETLLDALKGINTDSWHLDIVGDSKTDPGYTSSLVRKINRLQLGMNISWHGILPDEQLDKLWQDCHVLVVPSHYEGFGIVYLEAMAHGVVPIGSTAGGAGELIKENANGFLIRPGDARSLRAHLETLAENRESLIRLARNGFQHFAGHPTWEMSGEKIQTFLHERINQ